MCSCRAHTTKEVRGWRFCKPSRLTNLTVDSSSIKRMIVVMVGANHKATHCPRTALEATDHWPRIFSLAQSTERDPV
ncbi:hypothetical protein CRENBAI_003280 [Crenichthys baileyi]|uniref:Uncharacterized protein n=1 Tax=Crenichthys baileyi TaxID=28760 RepID=A0AAV9RSH2_9TELE